MLTLVSQRGNTRLTVHSPAGVIGLSPSRQKEWLEEQLVRDETTDLQVILIQLVRTVSEINVKNPESL